MSGFDRPRTLDSPKSIVEKYMVEEEDMFQCTPSDYKDMIYDLDNEEDWLISKADDAVRSLESDVEDLKKELQEAKEATDAMEERLRDLAIFARHLLETHGIPMEIVVVDDEATEALIRDLNK